MSARLPILVLALTVGMFAGCSSDEAGPSAPASSKPSPASLQPSDPDLASLYQQSCFSCHGTGAGGAPRTGTADWAPRLAQGQDVLLDHTINGYKGMPPLGLCMDCSEEEFSALIDFMISGAQ